jgi:Amt family ammonium transporter
MFAIKAKFKGGIFMFKFSTMLLFIFVLCENAFCGTNANSISSGDNTFIMISAALVFLMTPALALFYGGLVKKKNVLSTFNHSFVALGIITLQWIIFGYSLAFGNDVNGIIGGFSYLFLKGVGAAPSNYAPTIPHLTFMIYQGMFAIITPALISGAVAERIKFSSYVIFIFLWATFVYDPVAHWIWGGGWLSKLGVVDFAGGLVVHATCGVAALVAAIVVGKRKSFMKEPMMPHHVPMVLLGAGLLWFGWFGFNGGSALSSGALSINAFITTHVSAATALFVWMLIEWKFSGKPTALGGATGAIAGLATITPASGFVSPMSSILIGFAAAVICFLAIRLKEKFKYDDTLDVFGVHGVGGILGTLSLGLLAQKSINGVNGLFFGNAKTFLVQIEGTIAVVFYTLIATYIILKIVSLLTNGLKVSEEDELMGLDVSLHGESAYN